MASFLASINDCYLIKICDIVDLESRKNIIRKIRSPSGRISQLLQKHEAIEGICPSRAFLRFLDSIGGRSAPFN